VPQGQREFPTGQTREHTKRAKLWERGNFFDEKASPLPSPTLSKKLHFEILQHFLQFSGPMAG
jgi:hypothetical protein